MQETEKARIVHATGVPSRMCVYVRVGKSITKSGMYEQMHCPNAISSESRQKCKNLLAIEISMILWLALFVNERSSLVGIERDVLLEGHNKLPLSALQI